MNLVNRVTERIYVVFSRSSSSDEMLAQALASLRKGFSHDASVTSLRARWNLDADTAEKLVQQAKERLNSARSSPVSAMELQREIDNPGSTANNWPARRPCRRGWTFDIVDFLDSNRLAVLFVGGLLFFLMLMVLALVLASSSSSEGL